MTGPTEFLNLQNVGFHTLGSLSSLPGTQKYNTQGTTNYISGLANFYFENPLTIATTQAGAFNLTGTTFAQMYQSIFVGITASGSSYPYSFVAADGLFGANGADFWRIFGSTYLSNSGSVVTPVFGTTYVTQYSLPRPYRTSSTQAQGAGGGFTGSLVVYFAFKRFDGFIGPMNYVSYGLAGTSFVRFRTPTFMTGIGTGASFGSFGISGILAWYSYQGAVPLVYGQTGSPAFWEGGSTFYLAESSTSFSTSDIQPQDYIGSHAWEEFGEAGTEYPASGIIGGLPNPTTTEVFNNLLLKGGFASARDTVYFTDAGEYEKTQYESSFQVRANDGDIVTCIKSYLGNALCFKTNSISVLSGSGPSTLQLVEVSDQYGCLSANGACVFEQKLWFLDKKGIAEYNGANTRIISDKVEEYFQRMNTDQARYWGRIIHVKELNQVWCAIPIDGATYANIVIVYDYDADAWTTRTIDQCSALMNTTNSFRRTQTYFGDATGNIYNYGASNFADYTGHYTAVIQSRFLNPMGNSVQKMFRSLYLDAVVPPGATYPVQVDCYVNQGTSVVYSTTMLLSSFQQRIQFGISAKDISFKFTYSGGSFLQFNGFSVDYRYLRNT